MLREIREGLEDTNSADGDFKLPFRDLVKGMGWHYKDKKVKTINTCFLEEQTKGPIEG